MPARFSPLVLGAALYGAVLTSSAGADTLTLCTPVTEYVTIMHGFYVYDACAKPEKPPESDSKPETPLVDPATCWTFLQPTNGYEELPPFAFKIPTTPVTHDLLPDSAGALVAPPADTQIPEGQ